MPERTALPLDILYLIMEALEDDPASLCACALAGRALATCVRTSLYRHIFLSSFSLQRVEIPLLSRTLAADPSLGPRVRSLEISDPRTGVVPWSLPPVRPLCVTPELPLLHHLSELRTLILHQVLLHSMDSFLTVLAMFPKLEDLVCHTLLDATSNNGGAADDAVELITLNALQRRPFPSLRALVINNGYWNSHTVLADRLLLDDEAAIAGLQLLDLDFGSTAGTLWWAPVIRAAGATLLSLSISVVDPTPDDTIMSVPAGIERFGASQYTTLREYSSQLISPPLQSPSTRTSSTT